MSEARGRRSFVEEIHVAGDQVVHEIQRLVREGNVRHIRIKHDGHVVLEVPVTLAVVGGLLAPTLAALPSTTRSTKSMKYCRPMMSAGRWTFISGMPNFRAASTTRS